MQTREWRFVDKSDWGPGPWQDEPDKVQWVDKATGLPCMARRSETSGAVCGYVGVDASHPLSGVSYMEAPDFEVHGGLTYSDFCHEDDPEHMICHIPDPGEPERLWWFGFDTAHSWDYPPAMAARERALGLSAVWGSATYRGLTYVKAECARLAAQLARAGA
jgi:hypothetical protein